MQTSKKISIVFVMAGLAAIGLYLSKTNDVGNAFSTARLTGDDHRTEAAKITAVLPGVGRDEKSVPEGNSLRNKSAALYSKRRLLTNEISKSSDLHSFVVEHIYEARGDAEVAYALSSAISLCEKWGDSVNRFGLDSNASLKSYKNLTLFRMMESKCRKVLNAKPDEIGTSQSWLDMSARLGSGLAIYTQAFSVDENLSIDDRISMLRNAARSQDVDVVSQLAGYEINSDDSSNQKRLDTLDPESKSLVKTIAFQILRCELGADCSSDGVEQAALCQFENCKKPKDIYQAARELVPPWQYRLGEEYALIVKNDIRNNVETFSGFEEAVRSLRSKFERE